MNVNDVWTKTTGWLRSRGGLVAVCALPMLGGCMTNRSHQAAMEDRDTEIRELREERANLKQQIENLKANLETAHGELANAGAQMSAPAPVPAAETRVEKIPELDGVGVTYGMRDGNMVISIPSSITFASGEATLSKDGEKALREVAVQLKKKYGKAHYSIEGHTDSDPVKKSKYGSNRDLSIARARAVHTFLVVECSVPDERCIVVGHGEYSPVASNSNEKDKSKNRRVEIVVHAK